MAEYFREFGSSRIWFLRQTKTAWHLTMKERRAFEKYNATQPLTLGHVPLVPGPLSNITSKNL